MDRPPSLLRQVDLALAQALEKLVRGQVHQGHLVGQVEHPIRQGLSDLDARDAPDDVVEALQVLDIDRCPDVDAGLQQLLDVLKALGVAGARGIGVGQLVHQDQARFAGQGAVQVELLERPAAVAEGLERQDRQPLQQLLGLFPAVGLGDADEDVHRLCLSHPGGVQHGVGLAHTGAGAEEDLELTAHGTLRLGLDAGQQGIRVRAVVVGGHGSNLAAAGLADW